VKILSCFDGISAGRVAFERAGIPVEKYYASEIDKYAIKIAQKNYPDTIQIGDITKWREWNIEKPDMIIGGSPCQGFSFAGKQLNFNDPRSALFFVFVDILKHYKPKYFLLENVKMKKEYKDVISRILGEIYPEAVSQTELFAENYLEPIQINSALVSAQNRQRLYWTNIPGIEQPEDKGILLKDIIEEGQGIINNYGKIKVQDDKSNCIDANYHKGMDNHGQRTVVANIYPSGGQNGNIYSKNGKSPALSAGTGVTGRGIGSCNSPKIKISHNNSNKVLGKVGNQNKWKEYENKSPTLRGLARMNNVPRIIQSNKIRQSEKAEARREANRKSLDGKGNCLLSTSWKGEAANGTTIIPVKNSLCKQVGEADLNGHDYVKRVYSPEGKSPNLCTGTGGNHEPKISEDNITWRKLTPLECERLQTFPDNYTEGISNTQRYKCLRNSWTVDVIAHIFSYIDPTKEVL
jgi:DNA-cytosine methyltransferase